MAQHILLERAHKYDLSGSVELPKGCTYQHDKGYWTSNATGQIMMEGDDPKPPVSKKCDRETGEDQKGE